MNSGRRPLCSARVACRSSARLCWIPKPSRSLHSCPECASAVPDQGLVPLLEKYPIVDIRGRGLMSALEFGGRDGSLDAEPGTAAKLVKAAGERGLLILQAGAHAPSRSDGAPAPWRTMLPLSSRPTVASLCLVKERLMFPNIKSFLE